MTLLAALPTFQRLFPNFQTQCTTLYTILLPIAAVLLVSGLIAVVKHSQTPRSMLRPIITTMMIVMAIALWGDWTDGAKDALKTVVAKMDANPEQAAQRYVDILVSKEQPKEKGGWFGLPSAAQMYEAILWGILSLIGLIAQFIIWAAYIIQQFLIGLAYAFAPLFLGLLALRSTSLIGARFIMGTVGIIAWPLGWAAASIGTSNLIDVATEQGLVMMTNVYGLQTILAAALIGGWIIITTLIAPVIIQSAVSTGAQVGTALLGGALTAGAAVVSAGATTAAVLASGGTGATGILAGAGTSAVGSLAGSTMQGGGPALSGSLVQRMAYSMPRGRGSSTSSQGSSRSSGGTRASMRAPYNPRDASNDSEVQQMIAKSRKDSGRY
jgi:type IV secretion system protein TrbL